MDRGAQLHSLLHQRGTSALFSWLVPGSGPGPGPQGLWGGGKLQLQARGPRHGETGRSSAGEADPRLQAGAPRAEGAGEVSPPAPSGGLNKGRGWAAAAPHPPAGEEALFSPASSPQPPPQRLRCRPLPRLPWGPGPRGVHRPCRAQDPPAPPAPGQEGSGCSHARGKGAGARSPHHTARAAWGGGAQ